MVRRIADEEQAQLVMEQEHSGQAASAGSDLPAGADSSVPMNEAATGVSERAFDLIAAGGPVVAILFALSVLALAIVLIKLWQFRALQVGERRSSEEALRLWQEGRFSEAQALADDARSPVSQALARAIRGQRRGLPESQVREEVLRYGGDVLAELRGWFRPLEVIASLAPLLGLFGTVLGMIEAFRQLEAAGSRVSPAILSGGIWEALLTTAVGLAVAIPVVAVLNWLERRVERLAQRMDSIVTRIFTEDLSRDAAEPLQGKPDHEPTRLRPAAKAGE